MEPHSNDDQRSTDTPAKTRLGASPTDSGSFCIPTATVDALIDGKASAAEIACCLCLAAFTDETGVFSTASTNAVYKRTRFGWNKVKKSMAGLCERQVSGLPLVSSRERFIADKGRTPPDGPVERAKVNFAFETFGQPVEDRVWFGKDLVEGYQRFEDPLRVLMDAGDVAARLLLLLYRLHDLEEWIGVPPSSTLHCGFIPVKPTEWVRGGHSLIRFKRDGCFPSQRLVNRVFDASVPPSERWSGFQAALQSLIALGLVYESIVVVNRAPIREQGEEPGSYVYHLPTDAQPLYVLATPNRYGYKTQGEEGISGETANLAGELRLPVSTFGGHFDGTYAAFSPPGLAVGITGVYRLRFRVANGKNAFVRDAWTRFYEGERDALAHLQAVRRVNRLVKAPKPAPTS